MHHLVAVHAEDGRTHDALRIGVDQHLHETLGLAGFARAADDIADEGDASPAQRLADLAAYRSHDRELLGTVTTVAELRSGSLRLHTGDLTSFEEARAVERAAAERAVTTAEAMGRFYGQPALQGVLEGLLGELLGGTAAEHAGHAGEWLVAGLHAISQRAVPRARWGTLAELAAQWAVAGDAVRQLQARPELRTAVAQAVRQGGAWCRPSWA